ncbi:MAG: hypothetical protein M3186_01200 [Actinomycetota bacterium]|nr:hypothetical protein [Actinomycetota bacterium]
MSTSGRHRGPSRYRWLPVIAAAVLGVALGAGVMAATTSGSDSPTPLVAPQQATASSSPAPPSTPPQPAEAVRQVEPVGFATPATDASGLSLTVPWPEGINHGVRVTVAVTNPTEAPIMVDTAKLGPLNPTFDGTPVRVSMTPTRTKLMPGDGYVYEAVITLPTTAVGQLKLKLGEVTVAGQTSCGTPSGG